MYKFKAFSLLEMAMVIALLAGLYTLGFSKFSQVYESSQRASIRVHFQKLRRGIHALNQRWYLLQSPADHQLVKVSNIQVSFLKKRIFRIHQQNHIPAAIPLKELQATRLWYLAFSTSSAINTGTNTWVSQKLTGSANEIFRWHFIENYQTKKDKVLAVIEYNALTNQQQLTFINQP